MDKVFLVTADEVHGSSTPLKAFRRKYKAKLFIRSLEDYHVWKPKYPAAYTVSGQPVPEEDYTMRMDEYHLRHNDWASSHPAGMFGENADEYVLTEMNLL